ncbi:MAG: energy transducer TonB [Candidatus Zixiibacteriota bacterium]
MTREILMSFLLHLAVVAATLISPPFDIRKGKSYDEVIQVSLTTLPQIAPEKPEPVAIPEFLPEEPPEIPIDEPSTAKEVPIEKPKKKKEPKPRPKKTKPPSLEGKKKEIDSPVTSSEGSPFHGATIESESAFEYPYWFTQAFNKIAGNWRNPVVYDGTLVCAIYFQVIRSGRVVELRVEKSSGIPAFDKACLLAIERSEPFPPLPREFRDEIIGITVPFKNR